MRILACIGSLAVGAAVTLGAGAAAAAEDTPKDYGACTRKPTSGDTSAAKGAFQAGQAAFNEADYGRAITYWEDAFRRDCTANPLLLNLARSYELDGQKRHAVLALQTFLDRSPGSSEEGQIKRRIDKLNEQIAAENAAQSSTTATTTTTTTGTGATTGTGTTGTGTTGATAAGGAQPPAAADTGKRKRSPIPFIAVGGGVVLAAVGLGVYVSAASTVSDVEAQCPTRKNCAGNLADEGNSARTREKIGGALLAVGLIGGVGGGLVWYFMQPTQPATAALPPRTFRAGLRPDMGPGYSGLSVVGQF